MRYSHLILVHYQFFNNIFALHLGAYLEIFRLQAQSFKAVFHGYGKIITIIIDKRVITILVLFRIEFRSSLNFHSAYLVLRDNYRPFNLVTTAFYSNPGNF